MAKATGMSTPVIRGELREELGQFKQEIEGKLANLAAKDELANAVANLATKDELANAVANLATKAELEIWGGALLACMERMEQRLHTALARHVEVIREWMSTLLSASDERYADLPGRVTRLEATVFAPERR